MFGIKKDPVSGQKEIKRLQAQIIELQEEVGKLGTAVEDLAGELKGVKTYFD